MGRSSSQVDVRLLHIQSASLSEAGDCDASIHLDWSSALLSRDHYLMLNTIIDNTGGPEHCWVRAKIKSETVDILEKFYLKDDLHLNSR